MPKTLNFSMVHAAVALVVLGIGAAAASSCSPNPCLHGGTCQTTGATTFLCVCWPGYTGATCQTQMCYNNAVMRFAANGSMVTNTTQIMAFMWGAGGGSNIGDRPALPYPQAGSG